MDVIKLKDPFSEFQADGETLAKKVRDKIDQLIPGLGYPVVSVDVTVEENYPDYESNDNESLVSTLNRIDAQWANSLKKQFADHIINNSNDDETWKLQLKKLYKF